MIFGAENLVEKDAARDVSDIQYSGVMSLVKRV